MGFQHEVETPNITGSAGWDIGGPSAYWFTGGEGALYVGGSEVEKPSVQILESSSLKRASDNYVHLNASRESNLYSGSKLQTSALQVLGCIKT